ncbi:hypothetical protein M0802_002892 [Mischocyttarus mexicanus]|nr:hypothetical protein M0802_002892 [Mischocyttarus mexicanus]
MGVDVVVGIGGWCCSCNSVLACALIQTFGYMVSLTAYGLLLWYRGLRPESSKGNWFAHLLYSWKGSDHKNSQSLRPRLLADRFSKLVGICSLYGIVGCKSSSRYNRLLRFCHGPWFATVNRLLNPIKKASSSSRSLYLEHRDVNLYPVYIGSL